MERAKNKTRVSPRRTDKKSMGDAGEHHEQLVAAAHETVRRARSGDVHAARRVLRQAIVAIRGLMQFQEPDPNKLRLDVTNFDDPRPIVFHEPPDAERMVYLRGLLVSLIAVEGGQPPEDALNLRPPSHRLADPNIALRDAVLFVLVGQEFERLVERGQTRQDKPIDAAIKAVAKARGLSKETVQKAWSACGAKAEWEARKDDWK